MTTKKPRVPRCALCGESFASDLDALAHRLVAHPAVDPSRRRKITRVRSALARIHRRLEAMGLDEVQSHQVVQALTEELRKAGVT